MEKEVTLILRFGDMVINVHRDKLQYSYAGKFYILHLEDVGISSVMINSLKSK